MADDNKQEDTGQENEKQDKIYWHDAFYAALQLELHEYLAVLTFEDEYQLSKEALAMDVLIIKNMADIKIDKNIGQLFKKHNIFEYKSEKDTLSIWDYNKVIGYAFVYSAFEKIPIEDITISFVVTPKPIKLFDYLANDKGIKITEVNPGIYYVKGDTFPIQIIESKRLTAGENVFLKNLRSSLTHKDMEDVFEAYRKYDSLDKVNIYLNRVLDANKIILEEVLAMSGETAQDIIYRHFEKNGTLDRIARENQEKKARETALKMLRKGYALDEVADNLDMPVEWVQSLTK